MSVKTRHADKTFNKTPLSHIVTFYLLVQSAQHILHPNQTKTTNKLKNMLYSILSTTTPSGRIWSHIAVIF